MMKEKIELEIEIAKAKGEKAYWEHVRERNILPYIKVSAQCAKWKEILRHLLETFDDNF